MKRAYLLYDMRALEGGPEAAMLLDSYASLEDARAGCARFGGGVIYSATVSRNTVSDGDLTLLSEGLLHEEHLVEVITS